MRSVNRRQFIRTAAGLGASVVLVNPLDAAGADWTFIAFPDPQHLARTPEIACAANLYSNMMTWCVAQKTAWNIKFAVSLGDIVDTPGTAQDAAATSAWHILRDGGIPDVPCSGNHDSIRGPSSLFSASALFGIPTMTTLYGSGITLPGGGTGYWGGVYSDPTYVSSTMNSYCRFVLPDGRKLLLISMEFFPRASVMNWGKSIADSYPDHDAIVTTHGYIKNNGTLYAWNDTFGPGYYSLAASPAYNSGDMMWGGPAAGADASLTGYFATWKNLRMIVCGHDTGSYGGASYGYQRIAQTSQSSRAQTVQSIFSNFQPVPDCSTPAAMVMLCKVRPALRTLETYIYSTDTDQWLKPKASGGGWQSSQVMLESISWPAQQGIFPAPGGVAR